MINCSSIPTASELPKEALDSVHASLQRCSTTDVNITLFHLFRYLGLHSCILLGLGDVDDELTLSPSLHKLLHVKLSLALLYWVEAILDSKVS